MIKFMISFRYNLEFWWNIATNKTNSNCQCTWFSVWTPHPPWYFYHPVPVCVLQACERDVQCGFDLCCAVSLWLRGLRMCIPRGVEGDECHPFSHKVGLNILAGTFQHQTSLSFLFLIPSVRNSDCIKGWQVGWSVRKAADNCRGYWSSHRMSRLESFISLITWTS